jgi:superfamily II DNA or RNA helicase
MKVIRSSALVIPTSLNFPFIKNVKDHLTRTFKEYNNEDKEITINFYVQTKNLLIVPRYFPLNKYVNNEGITIEDRTCIGKRIELNHNIVPRGSLQEECSKWFKLNKKGILHADTGSGKTVMAIRAICEKRRKTLILVYKTNLVNQWRKEFITHTDISEKDWRSRISILNSSSYQKDLQKDIIIGTNQTFISLLKRKRNKFIRDIKEASIGILIGDEVHTSIGAPTFGLCSLYVSSRETFGLTATPFRFDGCHDIMRYHLGPLYTPVNKAKIMKPKIMVIYFDHQVAFGKTHRYIYWGNKFNRSRYLNMMYKSKVYMDLCLHLINKAFQKDRTMLFMHSRRKVLKKLSEECNIPKEKMGMFMESASLDETKKPYVFATFTKSRDGIDIPACDLVVLGNPIGNIAQAIGRSVRPKEGKSQPVIVDLVDIGCLDMAERASARERYYKMKEYEVEEFSFDGKEIRKKV